MGKTIRRMNDPVLGSTVTSENFRVPFKRVRRAVFQEQLHPRLGGAAVLDPARCDVPL